MRPILYAIAWIEGVGGRWERFPPRGLYGSRTWEPWANTVGIVEAMPRMGFHLPRLLVEQAAHVWDGAKWRFVRGPTLTGTAATVGPAITSEVSRRASWAVA